MFCTNDRGGLESWSFADLTTLASRGGRRGFIKNTGWSCHPYARKLWQVGGQAAKAETSKGFKEGEEKKGEGRKRGSPDEQEKRKMPEGFPSEKRARKQPSALRTNQKRKGQGEKDQYSRVDTPVEKILWKEKNACNLLKFPDDAPREEWMSESDE